jgi:hypothetical protein
LDRSTHLIVLACPEAAHSKGMELEASYWFSRPREGKVLIIISFGDFKTWKEIRHHLLPPSIRASLTGTPLWISLHNPHERILANPADHQLREELVEDLNPPAEKISFARRNLDENAHRQDA